MYRVVILTLLLMISTLAQGSGKQGSLSKKETHAKPLIHVLSDKTFRGDENQVLGIQDALQHSGWEFKNADYTKFSLAEAKKLSTPLILLLSGSTGLRFLKDNRQNLSKDDLVVWTGHQAFDDLPEISEKISVIFLPKHAVGLHHINTKTKVILLEGVPHRIMKPTLKRAFAKYEAKHGRLFDELSKVTAIVLPGDAPDESGKMKFFTPEDARVLARNIVKAEGASRHFLVTNGPRTGSHNYQRGTKLDPSPHNTKTVDAVSTAFIEELQKLGAYRTTLFDFQFSDLPSAYEPLLSLASEGVRIHIPGESTSMVTEATDVAENVCIDIVPSMNASHHKHTESIGDSARASILKWDGEISKKAVKTTLPRKSPAEVAAHSLLDFLGHETAF